MQKSLVDCKLEHEVLKVIYTKYLLKARSLVEENLTITQINKEMCEEITNLKETLENTDIKASNKANEVE